MCQGGVAGTGIIETVGLHKDCNHRPEGVQIDAIRLSADTLMLWPIFVLAFRIAVYPLFQRDKVSLATPKVEVTYLSAATTDRKSTAPFRLGTASVALGHPSQGKICFAVPQERLDVVF